MAHFSDQNTDLDGSIIPVYDEDRLGPHLLMSFGQVTINVQPSPMELYNIYRWAIVIMDRQKRSQSASRLKKRK